MEKLKKIVKDLALDFIEKKKNVFLTYILRPANSSRFALRKENAAYPKFGIVIQGPLLKIRNFTLETVRIYKKIFPEAKIIVSTWKNEDSNLIKEIESEEIDVILNEKPGRQGKSWGPNFNLQLISSLAGIKIARELGCKYMLKTRTDQRIYNPHTLRFLYNLTEKFPVVSGYKQKKRIVGISLNTFKYRLYGLSDMTVFGSVDDMMLFWNADHDYRDIPTEHINTNREFSNLRIGEVYLVSEFMKKINRELKWTLRDSWQIFAEHLCVVDQQSIELYWNKYKKYDEYRRPQYYCEKTDKEMTFSEWFEIYHNLTGLKVDEDILDLKYKEKIIKRGVIKN